MDVNLEHVGFRICLNIIVIALLYAFLHISVLTD